MHAYIILGIHVGGELHQHADDVVQSLAGRAHQRRSPVLQFKGSKQQQRNVQPVKNREEKKRNKTARLNAACDTPIMTLTFVLIFRSACASARA